MMNDTETQKLFFQEPKPWVEALTNEALLSRIKDTEFSKQQLDEGRDYCYFFRKIIQKEIQKQDEYLCMIYTLNQPSNLERASVYEEILDETETLLIHRISVIRDGVLIDKLPDARTKILDSEDQSEGGVINKTKKINLTIKDLRLYDILVIEKTTCKTFKEEDFIRNEFSKYVFVMPDTYWAYGHYEFNFINNGNRPIAYKKCFFRDANAKIAPHDKELLNVGESFQFLEQDYVNTLDTNREIYPFIDFATDSAWEDLSNFIYPVYKDVIEQHTLQDFAPDLKKNLDAIQGLEKQIRYAIEYVQNNIKYIYDAEEMHGHKPQDAAITYTNKQGDCKAKTILLKVILDYLNVESSIILVNYKSDFYLQSYLPSLLSFNHVILKVTHQNQAYFVDATFVDECGFLENRGFISFCHYLEILPNQTLQVRPGHKHPKYCIEEKTTLSVKDEVGELTILSTYRFHRANNMRRYFKNTNKRQIIDGWLGYLFENLNYHNDRNGEDVRNIFEQVELDIVEDDKDLNEVKVRFFSKINRPYFVDPNNKSRFLMFYDRGILKYNVQDHNHQDFTFWHGFDSEKYDITLSTDHKIDTTEKYTVQECHINNPYFTHIMKKEITKHSGRVIMEYNPLANLEIPFEEMPKLKEDYMIMHDSNFGIGIDIIEPGLMNQIKFSMKKLF